MYYAGEFLSTIEELHRNRGVPIVEIAKEFGVSRRMVYFWKNLEKRITPRFLQEAGTVFPELLSRNPRLKKPGVYFLENSEEVTMNSISDRMQGKEEKVSRTVRERLSEAHTMPVDNKERRLTVSQKLERLGVEENGSQV